MQTKRSIIIGDVHGCYSELQELLNKVNPRPGDEIILVGDLICKGPSSREVLVWAESTENVRCIMGNHEVRFLSQWQKGIVPSIKPYDLETYTQLGTDYSRLMTWIQTWPVYIEADGFRVVHGGILPDVALELSSIKDLTECRYIPGTEVPWYEKYFDPKLVVFGHWARLAPVIRENAIGLDTGCVYGGSLSALVLPEKKIISVKAQKVYFERVRALC